MNIKYQVRYLAHSHNLADQTCSTQNPIMNDVKSTSRELSKIIGASAKRLAQLPLHQDDHAPMLRPKCPTRWTVYDYEL